MLRALGKAEDASVAYGEFRRFAILMPRDKLMSDREPNLTWFESATCLPLGGAPHPASRPANTTVHNLHSVVVMCMHVCMRGATPRPPVNVPASITHGEQTMIRHSV